MKRLVIWLALASCRSAGDPMRDPRVLAGEIVVEIASVSLGDDCAPAPGQQPECQPTTLQLSIRGGTAGVVSIKHIDLLDSDGKLVGELVPRSVTRWDRGAYQPWDGRVDKGQLVKASYAVSSPNWDVLESGRWSAYRVRVTLASGTTLTKDAEFPAHGEPEVIT